MNRQSPAPIPAAGPFVGTAPVNWNNDDLPDWTPAVSFPAILDEMVAAGYGGTEYGNGFPRDPGQLAAALDERGLRLCGAYRWLHLRDNDALGRELAELSDLLTLLAAVGCSDLIVADAMTDARIALAGHVPPDGSTGLTDDAWDLLARNLVTVGRHAAEHGLRAHYHNHVGTHVETPDEVDRLLMVLPPEVDLCFDTGHYAYGGGDPTDFVVRHHDRIGYLHLKDVDPNALSAARAKGWGFLDALRHCIFCEFGEGMVDIPRVIGSLRRGGYEGWIVVEQDTSSRPPTVSARASRTYLRERCGL